MKLRFDTILTKIVLIQVVTLGVIALALFAASRMLLSSEAVQFERYSLRAHTEMIAKQLTLDSHGAIKLALRPTTRDFYAHGLGGLAYAITDKKGRILEVSRSTARPDLMGAPRKGSMAYFQSSDKKKSYLGLSLPVRVGGQEVWVQVTRKIRHPNMVTGDVAAYFLARIGWYAVPIVLLCFCVSVVVTRRMLRPIQTVSEMAGAIDPTRLDVRLPTSTLPREIAPLVHAVNRSLSTLEQSFRLQRDFTAHAAHELRTPLSILRMQIDGLRDREAASTLREDVDAMSHIVDQLLSAAEFEGMAVSPTDTADLREICTDVIAFMEPLALSSGKDIALTGCEEAVQVNGSAPMLYQAIRNLVENGLKYSPPGTCVSVCLKPEGIIHVLDDGPGIPESQRELVFRRFWRGDRANTNGAGMGLAIVARVAEAHGGNVGVADRAEGGAIFTLDLTAARQALFRRA